MTTATKKAPQAEERPTTKNSERKPGFGSRPSFKRRDSESEGGSPRFERRDRTEGSAERPRRSGFGSRPSFKRRDSESEGGSPRFERRDRTEGSAERPRRSGFGSRPSFKRRDSESEGGSPRFERRDRTEGSAERPRRSGFGSRPSFKRRDSESEGGSPRFERRDRTEGSAERPRRSGFGSRPSFKRRDSESEGGSPRFERRDRTEGSAERPRRSGFGSRPSFKRRDSESEGGSPRFERRDRTEGSAERPRRSGFGSRPSFKRRDSESEGSSPRFERRDRTEGSAERPRRSGFGSRPSFKRRDSESEGGSPRFERRDRTEGSAERPRRSGFEDKANRYREDSNSETGRHDKLDQYASGNDLPESGHHEHHADSEEFAITEKEEVRIAKRLAELGVCSRRRAETLVSLGKVLINDVTVTDLAYKVKYQDSIKVDGQLLDTQQPKDLKIFIIHKPRGYLTTNYDPDNRPTVFDLIPPKFGRLITIGRLDFNTEGLLLLTNNGDFARHMELPKNRVRRQYRVYVQGDVSADQLEELKQGVTIDGVKYGSIIAEKETYPDQDNDHQNHWIRITIFEGKNREIRNIMEYMNLRVKQLIRLSYGKFHLGNIPQGCIVEAQHKHHVQSKQ